MKAAAVVLGLIALLAAGTWLLGSVVAGGYASAIGLSAGWFAVVAAGTIELCRRRAELRRTVGGAFVVICLASLFGLWFTTIRETEVNEPLELGTPASGLPPAERPDVEDLLAPQ